MSLTIDRDLLAHALIVSAICVGGWLMFVEPRATEAARAEARIAELQQQQANHNVDGFEDQAVAMTAARQRLLEITDRNATLDDSATLYAEIRDLARQHGIQIDNMAPAGASGTNDSDLIRMAQIDLSIRGDYPNLAEFVESVNGISGFTRPRLLQLSPRTVNGQHTVFARFQLDCISFDIPDTLRDMLEAKQQ